MNTKGTRSKFGPSSSAMAASQNLQLELLGLQTASGVFRLKPHVGREPWSNTAGARE